MKRLWTLAFGLALLVQPAAAEQCGLISFGSFNVGTADETPAIEGTVDGVPVKFQIWLNSPYSGISESLVAKLPHHIVEPGDVNGIFMGSVEVTHVAEVALRTVRDHAADLRSSAQ